MANDLPLWPESPQLRYLAGYSYGMQNTPAFRFAHAVVATPRWAPQAHKESGLPVFLDNGSFPAFLRGEVPDRSEQVSAIMGVSVPLIGVVLPDIVMGGRESFERSMESRDTLEGLGVPMYLAVQEGYPLGWAIHVAKFQGLRLFVGGAAWHESDFKRNTIVELSKHPEVTVHVGRASRESHLSWCESHGVDSFDNTTFMRRFEHNANSDYAERLARYCRPPEAVPGLR